MVVDQLHDAGLNVKLFKSVQEDELFCLVGATEARLRLEVSSYICIMVQRTELL